MLTMYSQNMSKKEIIIMNVERNSTLMYLVDRIIWKGGYFLCIFKLVDAFFREVLNL